MMNSSEKQNSVFTDLQNATRVAKPKPVPIKEEKPYIRRSLYLHPSVNKTFKEQAVDRDVKVQDLMKEAISDWLKKNGCDPWPEDEN